MFILTDLFQVLTGEPHPIRKQVAQAVDSDANKRRIEALLDHKRRMAERDALLAADQT